MYLYVLLLLTINLLRNNNTYKELARFVCRLTCGMIRNIATDMIKLIMIILIVFSDYNFTFVHFYACTHSLHSDTYTLEEW